MEAKALTPRELFDGIVLYEIPAFQRPYVWSEEDQWEPLWDDIQRVAEALLAAPLTGNDHVAAKAPRHFLGAVVLKQLPSVAGDPSRRSVIDGQQRLTTLQLVLGAARLVMAERGHEEVAESLAELVANAAPRFRDSPRRFKLWPSRVDRAAFAAAMAGSADSTLVDARILAASAFFRRAIVSWTDRTEELGERDQRLRALRDALEQYLQIVAINLGADEDDQLIFETLNDRGTPLLAADLIKNYVFQRGEELGADTETWSEQYWKEFDEPWWRSEVAQGRYYRSRIDMFLQYWLTMRLHTEIPTDSVFSLFRSYAREHTLQQPQAEEFLAGLRRDADLFRDLAERDERTAGAGRRFYARVVEALELGVFIPLLLWLINDRQPAPQAQVERALEAVESWAVRRILLRRTMKDVNNLVLSLLKDLSQHQEQIGDATVAFLKAQQAEARQWPTDEELRDDLPTIKAYGNIKQARLESVLAGIELHLRTQRHEDVTLPAKLEIEHVMPQNWRRFWEREGLEDPVAEARRDGLVNSLGNLTLVTRKLNGALSDRPWTDAEAARVAPTGKDAGLGKRSLLDRYSVLVMNRELIATHVEAWREQDIFTRSQVLAATIAMAWPRD